MTPDEAEELRRVRARIINQQANAGKDRKGVRSDLIPSEKGRFSAPDAPTVHPQGEFWKERRG